MTGPTTASDSLAHPSTHSATDSTCRLLKLPAELRNCIYRLALVQEGDIVYNKDGYARPAVLNTCKKIRSEALKIFYYENTFISTISNYDVTAVEKFYQLEVTIGLTSAKVQTFTQVSGYPTSWARLLRWLRVFHAAKRFAQSTRIANLGTSIAVDMAPYIVAGMFDTARMLRGQPWAIVEDILTVQRAMLDAVDAAWLED